MNESKTSQLDIRLCRLHPWSNYAGLGFYITKCSRPPHLISLVESNSPAAAGGLRIWDVLIAINNGFVSNADYHQITMILTAAAVDKHRCIELLVTDENSYRISMKKNLLISSSSARIHETPMRMPDDYIKFPKCIPRTCEIRLQSNDENFGMFVTHAENNTGAYIQEVISGSPAYRVGLRKSDRIIRIDDKYVDKSSNSIIFEKLTKAFVKRYVKLFVMDTETYKVLTNLDGNVDRRSSTSNASDSLNSFPFDQQSSIKMTSKNSHSMNTPVIPWKKPLPSPQNHPNLQIFDYEMENTNTVFEAVSLQPTHQYEDLDSLHTSSELDQQQTRELFFKDSITDDIQNEPLNSLFSIDGYQDMPLRSLIDAVENLEQIIPQTKQNARNALEKSANPMDELTSDESAAIQLYTMEWKPSDQSLFVKLNHAFRANDRSQLTPYFPYLKLLFTGLWKLNSLQTTVWRGAHADLRAQYQIGQTFVWWGFSLCVESRELLESDQYLGNKDIRTLFHIKCKTGKSIRSHSSSKQEHEILLLPATQFQVLNQETITDSLFIIYLREIRSQKTLLQPPFDTDYSLVSPELDRSSSYQNESLSKFMTDHQMNHSICFSEQSLTINDIHLITNELHSNQYWKLFSIYRIGLDDGHMKSLMYALQSNLIVTVLDLKANQLNDTTSSIIALALKTNRILATVDLSDNQMTEIGAQSFANMLLINKTLLSLNLSSNAIGNKGIICILRALQHNNTLISLYLNRTKVTDTGIQELMINQPLKINLLRLYLNENHLGDEAITAIVRFVMQNRQLNGLHLAMNNITSAGAKKLAMLLQQSTSSLLELNLNDNPLRDAGVACITRALIKNRTLVELHLDSVDMTMSGVEEITNMICSNGTLKHLSLKKNGINDAGMMLLFNGLKFNHVLTHLHLQDNKFTDKSLANTVEKGNCTQILKCLYLSDHQASEQKQSTSGNETTEKSDSIECIYY